MKSVAAVLVLAIVAGCSAYGRNGARWVGRPAAALVAHSGMPDARMTAPSGARIYRYRDTLEGDTWCEADFFIRRGVIVGERERGDALNCHNRVGETD